MYNAQSRQPAGSLRISQDVIATIAGHAVKEIEGVDGIAPFAVDLKGWLLNRQAGKPIMTEISDDVATIDIRLNVKFGANIPQVSEKVQAAVKDAVQNMTGITVARVNINIAGIVFDAPADAE